MHPFEEASFICLRKVNGLLMRAYQKLDTVSCVFYFLFFFFGPFQQKRKDHLILKKYVTMNGFMQITLVYIQDYIVFID